MANQKAVAPSGEKITIHNGQIQCPDNPVILAITVPKVPGYRPGDTWVVIYGHDGRPGRGSG